MQSRMLGLRVGARRTLEWVLFGVLPVVAFGWWLAFAVLDASGDWAFDFRQLWRGGDSFLDGDSPYPSESLLETADDSLDPVDIQRVFKFAWPAGAALAFAPFGALGFDAAAAVWGCVLVASLVAALWILDVRDWRVAGVVAGSAPVIGSVRIGTMTPVLLLLAAVAWRWRDRAWPAGAALAAAISLKLFLWPLVVWLAATRRWRAAGIAVGLAAATTFGAWALIGFDGLADYPELLRRLTDVVEDRGFSLVALGVESGLPEAAAETLPWVMGLPLLVGAVVLARRHDGDRRAFSLAVVAAIALTPIVWLHYFALLVVPLALVWPRLAWAWALIWIFWLVPDQENEGHLWRILLAVAATAAVAIATAASTPTRPRSRRTRTPSASPSSPART